MQLNDTSISARKYAPFLSSVTKIRTFVHKFFCQMIKLLALTNGFVNASQVYDSSFSLIYDTSFIVSLLACPHFKFSF